MRRTLISAAIGVLLACGVFWSFDLFENLKRASEIAALQAQDAQEWLELSPVTIADGQSARAIEPLATWTVKPNRLLELRIAVNTRNIATGDPVCIGGTVTFIIEPSDEIKFTRPLSRIAGVDQCDWPPGAYRSRFTWTMTDPASRVQRQSFRRARRLG